MTPNRWQRIEELYHSAREREGSHRIAFLNEACAGDDALRQEIESLLVEEKGSKSLLELPALEIAAREMAQDQTRSLLGQRLGSLTPSGAVERLSYNSFETAGASVQAFGLSTSCVVGSKHLQLGSKFSRGSPCTRFQKVLAPPHVAGLFSEPRPNCVRSAFVEGGVRIKSPLW